MKKIYLSILASMLVSVSFATVHTVTNSGQTFTPAALNITVGDTVVWTIGGSHNVVEVDMATYTANGNTALTGGFSTPFGGDTVIFDYASAGMYYYVCAPHAGGGMKATINVAPLPASTGNLIMTMISDGDCSGGNPKVLELFADGFINFSEFALENQTNTSTTWGNTDNLADLGSATNSFVYIYQGATAFATEYPNATQSMTSGTVNFNGDDRVRLIDAASGVVLDQFGVDDTDGTGENWEYKDGFGLRNIGTGPDGTFVEANWTIINGGLDGLGICQGGTSPYEDIVGAGTYAINTLPSVSFKTDSFEFNEADGAIQLDTLLINPAIASPVAESFEIHLDAASTADASDFSISVIVPVTLPFTYSFAVLPNFTAQALDATLVDDALIEGDEWFRIVLRNGTNGLDVGADSTLYVKIVDNDFPADTFVELSSNALTVNEGDASFDIDLDYQQSGTNPAHTVDLMLVTGDAADVDNFTTMTATFSTLTEKFTVNLTDDMLVEGNETLTFALTNASNGLLIGSDSIFSLTIEDNDYPYYSIDLLRGNDTNGVADSLDVKCWTSGYILGEDLGSASREFSIHNGSKGLGVFIFAGLGDFGYPTVTEGDSIMILGTVNQFNYFSQMSAIDTMYVVGSSTIQVPTIVTDTLGEYTESELVTLETASIVNGTWGPNQTIVIAANGKEYDVRIDAESGVADLPEPNGYFNITGLGSQFNFSTTSFFQGYQLKPRYVADILLLPTINFTSQGASVDENAGTVTIDFTVANDNGGSYTVDVALTSGDAADLDNFVTLTGVAISGGVGSFEVTITDDIEIEGNEGFVFTVSNPSAGLLLGNANTFELTILDNDADAIEDINVVGLKLYPNPATHTLKIDFISNDKQISTIEIVDVLGRVVSSKTVLLKNGKNNLSFDVSALAKGNYAVSFSTETGKHTESIQVK